MTSVSAASVPRRRAHGVNDRLTERVSELNRVQPILHTNGKVDAEIEQCPSQMWGDWLIGRLVFGPTSLPSCFGNRARL